MFIIIGVVVVLGTVIGGYIMEHGNLSVLFQPAELIIIFGAALGALIIASPPKILKMILGNIKLIFATSGASRQSYIDILMVLSQLFIKARKDGILALEREVEKPKESQIFTKYPSVLSDHHLLSFICDNLKVIISTSPPAHELENLLEIDMEVNKHEEMIPSTSIAKLADSLPGLGIVAAVLGIVVTMGKINEPPEVLGHSIGAALVGTFLGILFCYGFIGPMATNLEFKVKDKEISYLIIKTALIAFVEGAAPQIALEYGRRAIPSGERPTFDELDKLMKDAKAKSGN
jgi:chemotaxis protein MotA